eukprot:4533811-Amphidinium_carterae.1
MRGTFKDSMSAGGSTQVFVPGAVSLSEERALHSHEGTYLNSNGVVTKYLQARQKFGMVLMSQAGLFIKIMGEVPLVLQVLESTKTVVMVKALTMNAGPFAACRQFQHTIRAACTDRAGSNIAAEKQICATRAGKWLGHHLYCELHCLATVVKRSIDQLASEQVSGMLHLALSLRQGVALSVFRRSLQEVLEERLVLLHGHPPLEVVSHREQMMSIFLSHRGTSLLHQMLPTCLPNGNWKDKTRVEYYLSLGEENISKEVLVQKFISGLTLALASHKPHLFPAHRWNGADVSISDLGKLEMIHGLLTATYGRFLVKMRPGKGLSRAATSRQVAQYDVAGESDLVGQVDPCVNLGNMLEADAQDEADGAAGGLDDPEEHRSASQHSQDRRLGKEWLAFAPLSYLLVMRVVLEPLMHCLHGYFKQASPETEFSERAKLAEDLLSGQTLESSLHRNFMVTLAADGSLENSFFKQIQKIFHDEALFQAVESPYLYVWFNAKVFIMLCRAACGVQQLIAEPHQGFPYCMYAIINDVAEADRLRQQRRCCMDEWSEGLLHSSLTDQQLQQVLEVHAHLMDTTTANVEARHAANRRLQSKRSLQTRDLHVETLSAEHMARHFRTSAASFLRPGLLQSAHIGKGIGLKKVGNSHPWLWSSGRLGWERHLLLVLEVKKCLKRKGIGGGLWRAFISKHQHGKRQQADFANLGRAYRAFKATGGDAVENLQKVAHAAHAAARSGNVKGRSAFGPTTREVERSTQKKMRLCGRGAECCHCPIEQQCWQIMLPCRNLLGEVPCLWPGGNNNWMEGKPMPDTRKTQLCYVNGQKAWAGHTASMSPLPCTQGVCMEFPPVASDRATLAAAWASHSRVSNLSKVLEQEWTGMHLPVNEEAVLPPPPPFQGAPRKCWSHGMCVCSAAGKGLLRMRVAMHKVMKASFFTKTDKDALYGGLIVFRFFTMSDVSTSSEGSTAVVQEHWYHCSMMYWRPYRATFTALDSCVCPTSDTPRSDRHFLKFYRLETSSRVLPQLHPSIVSVELYPGSPTECIWDPHAKPRRNPWAGAGNQKRPKKTKTHSGASSSAAIATDTDGEHPLQEDLDAENSAMDFCEEAGTLQMESDCIEGAEDDSSDMNETDELLQRSEDLEHLGQSLADLETSLHDE